MTLIRLLAVTAMLGLGALPLEAQAEWETLLDDDGVRADLDVAHVDRSGPYPRIQLRWFGGGVDSVFTVEQQEVDCTVPRVRLLETTRYRQDPDGDRLVARAGITPAWTRYIETSIEGRVLAATCEALSRT